MIRGLVSGLLVGGASGAVTLAVVSVLLPPPGTPAGLAPPSEPPAASAPEIAEPTTAVPAPLAPPPAESAPVVEPPRAADAAVPPVPETAVVEVPAGSEFGRGRDDREPVPPAAPEAAPEIAASPSVPAPAVDEAPDPSALQPAAAPAVATGPEAPGQPAPESPTPVPPADEAPVSAPPAATAPQAPAAPGVPVIAGTEPAAPPPADAGTAPAPVVGEAVAALTPPPEAPAGSGTAVAPDVGDAVAALAPAPEAPAEAPAVSGAAAGGTPSRDLPQIDAAGGGDGAPAAADPGSQPEVADVAPAMPQVTDVPRPAAGTAEARPGRLPQLGAGPAPADAAAADTQGALARNAAAFVAPEGADLLGLVLLDVGPEAGGLSAAALAELELPATIAIDATLPGASERAATLRAAGREVAILAAGLPARAWPTDLEVNFAAWAASLPGAALIVDSPEARIQNDRELAPHIVALAAAGGYGLVTHNIGLNTAGRLAAGANLPRAESYRIIEVGASTEAALRRTLDRAAFEAGRAGRVLIVASARPQTLAAITAWLDGSRRDLVPAPASAVLTGWTPPSAVPVAEE